MTLPDGTQALDCPDPFVFKGPQPGDLRWYLYCTSDAIDVNALTTWGPGEFVVLPMYWSVDLVHWTYAGAALPASPEWVGSGGNLWAPDVVYRDGSFFLYYAASGTVAGGTAVGVLTSSSPLGPWVDSGGPVVAPYGGRWLLDPEVITVGSSTYLYYGSYAGGVAVRELSTNGLASIPSTEHQVTLDNRYEGTFVLRHDGWYYLMASSTNCCAGPLTGYAVFAGRSRGPLGPFVDRDGVSLLATRVGGTPVLTQNGNRWIGPGHNSVVTDYTGQDWIFYHAVDQNDPWVPGQVGYTRRQLLMDPLDWHDGWPTVNGGRGPSDLPQPGPAAQPGEWTAYRPVFLAEPRPGRPIRALSDDFDGSTLSPQWTWIRPPDASSYQAGGGEFTLDTQPDDLQPPSPQLASVLTEPAPPGDYLVQTSVDVDVPNDGSGHDYVQGGIVIYRDDGNYVKLAVSSLEDSRQSEFGKHTDPVPAGFPSYGNTVVGPVGATTYLRIVHRLGLGVDEYTAYTSLDGQHWDAGGTWDLPFGTGMRIGLVSMGGSGYTSTFGPVRVSWLD
ncbi:MAG TPA: family 43 glycosylhydrolase [Pseudonocardiaceae bacterium]|nr:family 43 glycosylhydrolase [Pseudonocardiaceae bacterium]